MRFDPNYDDPDDFDEIENADPLYRAAEALAREFGTDVSEWTV